MWFAGEKMAQKQHIYIMNNIITLNRKNIGIVSAIFVFAVIFLLIPSISHAWTGTPIYHYGYDYPPSSNNSLYYGNYGGTYNYSSNPIYIERPVYYQVPVPVYYPPLSVSCSSNTTYTSIDTAVRWTANVSGGNGYYSYTWSGTDNLTSNNRDAYKYYKYPGQKYATVTVFSNGQTITQTCSNSVAVYEPAPVVVRTVPVAVPVPVAISAQPVNTMIGYNTNLDIGCYADPQTAKVDQPVTWTAEVTGGMAPYTYSWSGSNDLSGSQSSVTKWYSTSGDKYAIVTVTSADSKTATKACTSNLVVKSNAVKKVAVQNKTNGTDTSKTVSTTNANQTASASFSLGNVPWGWIAIVVILLLFITVMYLLFNKQKI